MAVQPDEDEESFNTISNQYPEIYFQPLTLTGMRIISVIGNREWGSLDINLKHYLADLQKSNLNRLYKSFLEPPPEDHLLQNTLWPEIQKL